MLPDFVETDEQELISHRLIQVREALNLTAEAVEEHWSVSDTLRAGEPLQHLPWLRNGQELL